MRVNLAAAFPRPTWTVGHHWPGALAQQPVEGVSTVLIDEGRIARHIVPLIGTIPARDLRRADVQRMADAIAKGKTAGIFKGKAEGTKPRGRAIVTGGSGTAARVVELLGGIYSWAEKRELAPVTAIPRWQPITSRDWSCDSV